MIIGVPDGNGWRGFYIPGEATCPRETEKLSEKLEELEKQLPDEKR